MDELQRSLLNVFTYSDLDRMVKQRKEQEQLDALQTDASSRYILFHRNRFLIRHRSAMSPRFLDADEIGRLTPAVRNVVFLGSRKAMHYFAAELEDRDAADRIASETQEFVGLRESGRGLKARDASMLSYAKAMFNWHEAHRFCGVCGYRTKAAQGGHVRKCISEECATTHFPRTDPAIIVSVVRDGKCLFGRQKTWPPKRYSVIAGFVEPGESVEQAVAREVLEETNIETDRIHYHSSQPWPFPGSIMLGFSATAASEAISLNDGELQDAHWRSPGDVLSGLAADSFRLPTPLSIAYRLIEDWFNENSGETLQSAIDRLDADRAW